MTLGLSKKWIDKMKSLPESGMGHQSVEVKLKNGIILRGTVMNSNILKVDGYNLSFQFYRLLLAFLLQTNLQQSILK